MERLRVLHHYLRVDESLQTSEDHHREFFNETLDDRLRLKLGICDEVVVSQVGKDL